ncbi:MAG: endolytic transglycosylase MltG, partial [Rhodococcus fascians]
FSKVARVIVNRLAEPQKLEFDSTVNYALDTTEVATTDLDRATVTPWNTYAMEGLPATPIAAPSVAAVEAVEAPADGDWLYFVTINAAGDTLFTRSYDEHLANIGLVEDGFLESGR